MKILSWNCRGLGSPRAVRALLRLFRVENPDVVFVMESRLKKGEVERVKIRSGCDFCFAVDCNGLGKERAGGLILFWKEVVQVNITSFSLNHIGGEVIDVFDNQVWHFNGVYGFPEEHNKRRTWSLIQDLRSRGG